MAQEGRVQLKTYFETGDVPTEEQFASLIDSAINITDDLSLPTTMVGSSLTTVGTIGTGVWQGTAIDHERGGLEADVSLFDGLLKISGGTTSQITDNSTNWNTAYTHSQITSGNPHSVSLTDFGVTSSAAELNYNDGLTPSNSYIIFGDGSKFANSANFTWDGSLLLIKSASNSLINLDRGTTSSSGRVSFRTAEFDKAYIGLSNDGTDNLHIGDNYGDAIELKVSTIEFKRNIGVGVWNGSIISHEYGGLEANVSAYSGLVKISGGTTSQITDNSTNWNTAYTHSQITSGNPHSVSLTDFGVTSSAAELNYLDGYVPTNIQIAYGDGTKLTSSSTFVFDGTKVGIGTASPDYSLTISGTSNNNVLKLNAIDGDTILIVNTQSSNPFMRLYKDGGSTIGVDLNTNGNSYFSGGNVGIGTASPNQLLTVENSISLKEIAAANADAAAYGQIWVKNDAPNVLWFTDDAGNDKQLSGILSSATTIDPSIVTSSLTTVGTIGSGTWQGAVVGTQYGGTGVANGANNTITFTGNFTLGLTLSNNTSITLPTSGTLVVNSGTPVNNQLAVWTNANTIEGDTGLTWDGTRLVVERGSSTTYVGTNCGNIGDKSVGFGTNALNDITTATQCVGIGYGAGNNITTGSDNIAIGYGALSGAVSAITAANNISIGTDTLTNVSSSANNVVIGYQAGHSLTTNGSNIFIGYQAAYNETGANKLYIENSNSATPLIYGEFDNDKIIINGQLEATTGSTYGDASLVIDQNDPDEPFINYEGTSDSDDSDNIILDTTTLDTANGILHMDNIAYDWHIAGAIRVNVNGNDFWIPFGLVQVTPA